MAYTVPNLWHTLFLLLPPHGILCTYLMAYSVPTSGHKKIWHFGHYPTHVNILTQLVNAEFRKVGEYFRINRMVLHPDKTNLSFFREQQ